MRGRRGLAAAIAALSVALFTGACGSDTPNATPPSLSPTTSINGVVRATRVGVSLGIDAFGLDDAALLARLDAVSATGAAWIRVDLDWSVIQRDGRDVWDFSATDRVLDAALDRGLRIIGLLTYTPEWARPIGTPDKHPPSDPNDFARFAAVAVDRYANRGFAIGINTWEIWNEPNLSRFWFPKPDPAVYARLLVAAANEIRRVQPGSTILSGGLAPGVDDSGGATISAATFLERVYDSGGGDAFDAVAIHPYSYPFAPLYAADWNTFANTPLVARVLRDHGDGDRRIWGTEVGAPTAATDDSLSLDEQAQLLTDAYDQWLEWEETGPLIWYTWQDTGIDGLDPEQHFGLVTATGAPKPALTAFTRIVDIERALDD